VGRQRSAKPLFVGSNPTAASRIRERLATGASGGTGYTLDLKSNGRKAVRVRIPSRPLHVG
jgi:hypothetical protein